MPLFENKTDNIKGMHVNRCAMQHRNTVNIINSSFLVGMPLLALVSVIFYSLEYGISWVEPIIFVAFYSLVAFNYRWLSSIV